MPDATPSRKSFHTVPESERYLYCPICGRNRRDVAKEHPRVFMQYAIGKFTACVQCGTAIIEKRDARRAADERMSSLVLNSYEKKVSLMRHDVERTQGYKSAISKSIAKLEAKRDTLKKEIAGLDAFKTLFGDIAEEKAE